MRDGYIVHYKDYWNPVAALRTLRGQTFVQSLMSDRVAWLSIASGVPSPSLQKRASR
jgi:hypothetical protein